MNTEEKFWNWKKNLGKKTKKISIKIKIKQNNLGENTKKYQLKLKQKKKKFKKKLIVVMNM